VRPGKVLITGATGFLGQHLAREGLRRGLGVVALCRDPDGAPARQLPAEVERVRGDALDAEAVKRAAQGCTRLVHAAGLVSRDPADTLKLRAQNVVAVATTLAAARESGVERAVHVSTSGTVAVSRDAKALPDEQSPVPIELINRWPYYRSKLYGERAALEQNQPEQGFSVILVNPSLLLGPGDVNGSATSDVQDVLQGRVKAVPTGGMSFADVRDVAQATFAALEQGRAGARYLLTSCNTPLATFCQWLAELGNVRPPSFRVPALEWAQRGSVYLARRAHELGMSALTPDPVTVDMAQHYWYADSSLASRELGWAPRDPLVTLHDTIADLRERGFLGAR
jgi:nucleoside-diphosphate-sugar epimerase